MSETEQDLKEERKMADKLSKAWDVDLVKLPKYYHLDYAILKDKIVVGYAEFKRRHFNADKYKTLFVGLKKWLGLVEVDKEAHKPVYLVMQTDDKMLYTRCDGRPLEHTISGARGVAPEPVVHFATDDLKEVKPRTKEKWASIVEKSMKGKER